MPLLKNAAVHELLLVFKTSLVMRPLRFCQLGQESEAFIESLLLRTMPGPSRVVTLAVGPLILNPPLPVRFGFAVKAVASICPLTVSPLGPAVKLATQLSLLPVILIGPAQVPPLP